MTIEAFLDKCSVHVSIHMYIVDAHNNYVVYVLGHTYIVHIHLNKLSMKYVRVFIVLKIINS